MTQIKRYDLTFYVTCHLLSWPSPLTPTNASEFWSNSHPNLASNLSVGLRILRMPPVGQCSHWWQRYCSGGFRRWKGRHNLFGGRWQRGISGQWWKAHLIFILETVWLGCGIGGMGWGCGYINVKRYGETNFQFDYGNWQLLCHSPLLLLWRHYQKQAGAMGSGGRTIQLSL